ncbi:tryptophan synthase subunit beta like protein [Halomonas sabkhae]|uniref:tryptophan synthase subunit beta like protein n=1 Tax=Halomonas sabkhae TaxID=626223 RepID=UPI0025B4EDF8|nr:tryptophan synthase subunit beta like protein [Halomonas sabkhae]MDN3526341.1 tryptophan synthase subunit beta like protein [Halomonas sabkhae]
MYVRRDSDQRIQQVSREPTSDCSEFVAADSPELLAFMTDGLPSQGIDHFQTSDLAFVRVVEDLIQVLMDKGVISFVELPEAAQDKVLERQRLRHRVAQGLDLVSDEDEDDDEVI